MKMVFYPYVCSEWDKQKNKESSDAIRCHNLKVSLILDLTQTTWEYVLVLLLWKGHTDKNIDLVYYRMPHVTWVRTVSIGYVQRSVLLIQFLSVELCSRFSCGINIFEILDKEARHFPEINQQQNFMIWWRSDGILQRLSRLTWHVTISARSILCYSRSASCLSQCQNGFIRLVGAIVTLIRFWTIG